MKLRNLILVFAGLYLLGACERSEEIVVTDNSSTELKCAPDNNANKHRKPAHKTVTVPFKADFIGNYVSMDISDICGDYPWIRIINDGGGTATLMGKFTHHFDFCCDFVQGYYPGNYMKAWFVAANGDSLFVSCSGQVVEGKAPDHPEYVTSYFRDPFVILGGTGRFKGATGSGMTDDYNSSEDAYSHHHWTGTITLVKGKR